MTETTILQYCTRSLASVCLLLLASSVSADVILSPSVLNESLKEMQRIRQELEQEPAGERPELLFRLGREADELALVFTNETIVYGRAQQKLIKLGLDRTAEMDVNIRWFPAKERFIYDGAAFEKYLELAPDGPHAGDSAFQLLQKEFYESAGSNRDTLLEAAANKRDFLQRFPDHERAPEVSLMLAIDYRDLWRLEREQGRSEAAADYLARAREQYKQVASRYAGTRAARNAEGLLQRLNQEQQDGGPAGEG